MNKKKHCGTSSAASLAIDETWLIEVDESLLYLVQIETFLGKGGCLLEFYCIRELIAVMLMMLMLIQAPVLPKPRQIISCCLESLVSQQKRQKVFDRFKVRLHLL